MVRRTRNSSLVALVLPLLAFVGVVVLVGYLLLSQENASFRSYPQFPVSDFLENPASLRGNTYQLDGEVANVLANSPSRGRLLAVRPQSASPMPVLLPTQFQDWNIQKGQRYIFLVRVNFENLPEVIELKK